MSELAVPIVNINIAGDEAADSEDAVVGGDTNSSLNQSSHSVHDNSEAPAEETDSNAPLSSRGSTRATGEDDDTLSYASRFHNANPFLGPDMWDSSIVEEEKEPNGTPILTNRFLRELFKKEHKKYYRTPWLNDKLYLHYKGFSRMKNMEQFTELKCLYFEGNGCDSLLGLENCKMMMSLFVQENCITKIEGLDTLKDLRQVNLTNNMIKKVEGLENCTSLDTLYLKGNRLGQSPEGDIESLKGLLERPTLTCIDISDNYLTDPEILPEIFAKMQQLRVIYSLNNKYM